MKDNFLSSGVYGCVYHPPYDCQGRPKADKKEVAKIVKSDFTTTTEYNIGQMLKQKGFVTIKSKCNIKKTDLEKSRMRPNCKLLSKDPKLEKDYLLLYSDYVKSQELSDYLKTHNTIRFIMKAYFLICERIDTLLTFGIIHHDLHFGNIMCRAESEKRKLRIYEIGDGNYLYTYMDFETVIIYYGYKIYYKHFKH